MSHVVAMASSIICTRVKNLTKKKKQYQNQSEKFDLPFGFGIWILKMLSLICHCNFKQRNFRYSGPSHTFIAITGIQIYSNFNVKSYQLYVFECNQDVNIFVKGHVLYFIEFKERLLHHC